jgi:hypothetical protein
MNVRSVFLLPGFLAALLMCTACRPEKLPESKLVFFGFNEVFLGQWFNDSFALTPLSIPVRVRRVASVAQGAHEDDLTLLGVDDVSGKFTVYLFSPFTGVLTRILDQDSLDGSMHKTFGPSPALTSSGNQMAYLAFGSLQTVSEDFKHREVTVDLNSGTRTIGAQNVWLYDLASRRSTLLVKEKAFGATSLSWIPNGHTLTFDSLDGSVESVDIKTHGVSKIARGRMPAWSPDGKQLAYVEDKTLVIKDDSNGLSRKIYKRWFWQSDFAEHLSWSPDGRYLAFNVYAGFAGYEYECIVIEVGSETSFSVHTSSYFCSSWVKSKNS